MIKSSILPFFGKALLAFPSFVTRTFLVRLRILPLMIFFAVLMFTVRVQDIRRLVREGEGTGISMTSLGAQTSPPSAPSEPPAHPKSDTTTKPSPDAATKSSTETTSSSTAQPSFDPLSMTKEEIDVLQHLSTKQDEINKKRQDLTHKATLLTTVEKRVDDKLKTLQGYKLAHEALLKKKDNLDKEQIKGLVKIYESMKPQEAATILEGMNNIEIVHSVVSSMKEAKASAILAKMHPENARALTVRLANKNKDASSDQSMIK